MLPAPGPGRTRTILKNRLMMVTRSEGLLCLNASDFLLQFQRQRLLLNIQFPRRFNINSLFTQIFKIISKGFSEIHDKIINSAVQTGILSDLRNMACW